MFYDGLIVEKVYRQGDGPVNEDRYIEDVARGLFAVIDGATALSKKEGASGAFSAMVIEQHLHTWDGKGSLLEAVLYANRMLGLLTGRYESESEKNANKEPSEAGNIPERCKEEYSSCGLAAVKFHVDGRGEGVQFSYVQAGDCMLFVRYDDGTIRALTYDHVSPLDNLALQELIMQRKGWLESGVDPNRRSLEEIKQNLAECRQKIYPLLQQHRRKMNTKDGYGILDGTKEAELYLESGVINLNHLEQVLLLTDGLMLPTYKTSIQEGWMETAHFAFETGIIALEQRVLEMEAADPACYLYPRFKPADDKTGILIRIKK